MTDEHLLDDCGCCRPSGATTPAAVSNTPGKPSLERRVGTSAGFAATMAARLSREPALERFTSRRADDPAIALVDAWSAVLDVLTFYSERVTNEGYLRTATDPRSLTELAHSVGYAPGRGRASATALAFTLEDAAGSPPRVPIPLGTRVASLPGPGEVPQTYETTSDLVARPAWNALQARTRLPQLLRTGDTAAYVEGVRTNLVVGDAILLVGSEREASGAETTWAFRQLALVQPLPEIDATRIGWTDPLGTPAASSGRSGAEQVPDPRDARLFALRRKAAVFGAAAPDWRLISKSAGGGRPDPSATATVERAARILSHERTTHGSTHRREEAPPAPTDWAFSVVPSGQPENTVDLDTTYPAAVPGSWMVLSRHGATASYRIVGAVEESRTDFTLTGKVTRLTLTGPTVSPLFGTHVRETSAWVGSDLLPLATVPDPLPVHGLRVSLARRVPTLEAGRPVVVVGPRPGVRVAEGVRTLVLKAPSQPDVHLRPGDTLEVSGPVTVHDDGAVTWVTTRGSVTAPPGSLHRVAPAADAEVWREVAVVAGPTPDRSEVDTLDLAAALTGCYDREAVRILANVAPATHGETRIQTLGSGDAARSYQEFTLAQKPLTYVLARSGGAVLSTLEVRVDGRRWREVPRLLGTGPDDEVFTTRMDDEGAVAVVFGDGRTGSRLPTGSNNVTARFRVGTGIRGRVAADALTLPMTRPLGLRSVTNPLPTGLAADPESTSEIRANTPRTALTLDRVVSLRDVEDFARSVPGIAKARATWLWDGSHRFVHLTVAGTGGQTLDPQAVQDLRAALLAAGDARLPLRVEAADVVTLHVSVSVVVDPAHERQAVLAAVSAAISAALSVEARALGQPLTSGDIILAAHSVAGVVAVNVTLPKTTVASAQARTAGSVVRPAQLVVLAPGGLTVTEASS